MEGCMMKTVELGRTGLKVNSLGFGGIPIQRISAEKAKEVVEYAIKKGINFIDTARLYTDSEEKIGQVLPKYCDQVIIATKAMSRDKAGMAEEIEISLKKLKVDCIDLYQCHNVRSLEQLEQILSEDGAYSALLDAQKLGKIKYIGISSHKHSVLIEAAKTGKFDTIQVAFNIIEPEAAEELFPLCEEMNLGVIIMKPVAGGALQNHVPASLKYILNNSAVSVVIPGMESTKQVDENFSILENPNLSTEEAIALEKEADELGNEFCRRCDYCAPCPQGIDIPVMFILNGYATRYNMADWAAERYDGVKIKTNICVECGQCERKCPYDLPIIKMLKDVHKNLSR